MPAAMYKHDLTMMTEEDRDWLGKGLPYTKHYSAAYSSAARIPASLEGLSMPRGHHLSLQSSRQPNYGAERLAYYV